MYVGWSESENYCRKHPNEIPQPGICPSCLRERLSTIQAHSRASNVYSSSPVYYFSSSATSSGCASPATRRRHHRVASDIMDSVYMAISGNINGLKKSRSIAFASRNNNEIMSHVNDERKKKKKKGGFWNKLLLLRSSSKKAKF